MGTEGFRDKVVIITGASSGIGEALAYHLAQAGAFLALAARSAGRLETVAAECRRLGAKAASGPTDVSDEGQCKALVASTLTTYGRIDALVNNAGFGVGARFANLPSLALFVDVLNTNFMGSVYVIERSSGIGWIVQEVEGNRTDFKPRANKRHFRGKKGVLPERC